MTEWTNFLIVIAIQAFWFAFVTTLSGNRSKILLLYFFGFIFGIPYGFFMDVIIGSKGSIFLYINTNSDPFFLLLNATLSYGLALSTAGNFCPLLKSDVRYPRCWTLIYLIALGALAITFNFIGGENSLVDMFIFGAVIIAAVDFFSLLILQQSFVFDLIRGRRTLREIGMIAVFFASTGVIYECANYFNPLWEWENKFPNVFGNLVLVALLGYPVLLYPMMFICFITGISDRWGLSTVVMKIRKA